MNRLCRKIDMIKMKRTNKNEDHKNVSNYNDEDKFNFEKNELPMTSDFKVQNLTLKSQSTINFLY